jgi:hypothetical protein
MTKKKSKIVKWFNDEVNKDQIELNKQKEDFIQEIKKLKKQDILPEKPKKLTLWNRIKKVLMG